MRATGNRVGPSLGSSNLLSAPIDLPCCGLGMTRSGYIEMLGGMDAATVA